MDLGRFLMGKNAIMEGTIANVERRSPQSLKEGLLITFT